MEKILQFPVNVNTGYRSASEGEPFHYNYTGNSYNCLVINWVTSLLAFNFRVKEVSRKRMTAD